jgi:hypothetical protein
MPKQTHFTNITPLPANIPRQLAIAMLHNHDEMIQLNPLVIEHHPIEAPRDAPADEFLDCVWQEMTDKISYLPGIKGKVSYKACFHDNPKGLQTHIYAPLGVDIREKWSIGGSLPGEPREPRELGVDTPTSGLYLREDGDLRCNRMTHAFVLKNLDTAHKVLVERIIKKAQRIDEFFMETRQSMSTPSSTRQDRLGPHISNSAFIQAAKGSLIFQADEFSQATSPPQDADPAGIAHSSWKHERLPPYSSPASGHYSVKSRPTVPNSASTPITVPLNQRIAELPV